MPVFQECGADQRLHDVAQDRILLGAALFGLAMAQQDVGAHFELGFGDGAQRVLRNGLGSHLRQLALGHIRVNGEQRFRGDQFQHRVAKELKAFVVGHAGVFVREGSVGKRLHQQVGADGGAQRFKQFAGWLLLGFFGHGGSAILRYDMAS